MTLVFFKLMVRPKARHALEKISIINCKSSVWVTRFTSFAKRSSRTRRERKVFDLVLKQRSLKTLPEILLSECILQCHNLEMHMKA